jgi:hypothetical protein
VILSALQTETVAERLEKGVSATSLEAGADPAAADEVDSEHS